MQEPDFFQTIDREGFAEFEDRGSSFLAWAFPLAEPDLFKEKRSQAKKQHPKATHHCFAYRVGWDGTVFRSSDDGEPSGTAGRPILAQIDSRGLINTGIIVTRYFGGTLLGVPGLIHAYKTAASFALQMTPVVRIPVEKIFSLECDYTQMDALLTTIRLCGGRVLKQQWQLYCQTTAAFPKNRADEFRTKMEDFSQVTIAEAPTER